MFSNKIGQRIHGDHGQALTEIALVLPIFIMLIAGVVEVSNLLTTKNRLETAARAAARFGASGGNNDVLDSVVLNTVTQTLSLESGVWDIWALSGTIIDQDNLEWEVEHIYGNGLTTFYTETNSIIATDCQRTPATLDVSDPDSNYCLRDQILAKFQRDLGNGTLGAADLQDIQFLGVYIIHDLESILGLNALPALSNIYGVSGLGIMRIPPGLVGASPTDGCFGFPIAVHEGIRSLTDVDGGNPYPQASDFDYPNNPPSYAQFFNNVPQIPLTSAQEGYIFKAQNGFGNGNFGWLRWNQGRPGSANVLADSLGWPGDSHDYSDNGDNNIFPATPLYPHIVRGYVEPIDALDIEMHIDDWVSANTGSVNANAVRTALEDTIDAVGRTVRLIVWKDALDEGSGGRYQISGFIIARLVGYSLSQNQGGSWILIEFVRWDTTCGQNDIG